jgi:nicotinate phosphoribosyltransferase
MDAAPVLIVRGRYRDFALLKTPILGVLSRASRIATNAYCALQSAMGKPVYFFSARYDPPEIQAADGYAYHVAIQRYNRDYAASLSDAVSTYANAEWWGGEIEGTISHEAIACFLGDTAELMIKFAEVLPPDRIRVALVDFHNDCVEETRKVLRSMFAKYNSCIEADKLEDAMRYKLHGIRVDTSKELVDRSIAANATPVDYGPSPRLIRLLRETIDNEWRNWELDSDARSRAEQWCKAVKIMVSGGFTHEKISSFESAEVPVDFYGMGSALLSNCVEQGTTTDFSAVIMKTRVGDNWVNTAKAGRRANYDSSLKVVRW